MPDLTRGAIVEAAKVAARKHDGPLSKNKFIELTGYSDYYIYRMFPEGGWSEIRTLAGLDRHPNDKDPLTDEQLLEEYHRVAINFGKLPTWAQFASIANISVTALTRRFGNKREVRMRYREWLEKNFPKSPLLELIPVDSNSECFPVVASPIQKTLPARWKKVGGLEFGAPIDFRGLRHAPINEQGVVYLFGMVSLELGLIVEAVQSSFPDCEAKRRIDPRLDRWQRVRVEFEYLSRNFRDHGHDPDGCDLIVCWEHNWPECPLEVIALKAIIGKLEG